MTEAPPRPLGLGVVRWAQRHGWLSLVMTAVLVVLAMWGASLYHLARAVGRDRTYWTGSVVVGADSAGTPLRYVAMGDSAAQGIGATDPQHGYVSLVAAELHRLTGRPVVVVNISHSGDRVDDVVRDQLPRLADLRADVVTVDVGGNDVRRYDAADWARGAARLCAALPAGRAAVADVPWFMHGHWERDAAQARGVLTRDCAAAGVAMAPLASTFEARGLPGMLSLYAADWFHPDDEGHRLWAQAFERALVSNQSLLTRLRG